VTCTESATEAAQCLTQTTAASGKINACGVNAQNFFEDNACLIATTASSNCTTSACNYDKVETFSCWSQVRSLPLSKFYDNSTSSCAETSTVDVE